MVLDAGFDSAHNHQLLRDYHGILSVIPPLHGRPAKDPNALPTDKYRSLMKTRFNKKAYRRRGQIETAISILKRNLGSALRGRSYWSRCRDLQLAPPSVLPSVLSPFSSFMRVLWLMSEVPFSCFSLLFSIVRHIEPDRTDINLLIISKVPYGCANSVDGSQCIKKVSARFRNDEIVS